MLGSLFSLCPSLKKCYKNKFNIWEYNLIVAFCSFTQNMLPDILPTKKNFFYLSSMFSLQPIFVSWDPDSYFQLSNQHFNLVISKLFKIQQHVKTVLTTFQPKCTFHFQTLYLLSYHTTFIQSPKIETWAHPKLFFFPYVIQFITKYCLLYFLNMFQTYLLFHIATGFH